MDLKVFKWHILPGSLMKRLVIRALLFTTAMLVVSFVQIAHEVKNFKPLMLSLSQCPFCSGANPDLNVTGFLKPVSAFALPFFGTPLNHCKENEKLTKSVFEELMEKALLDCNDKALCVGEGSSSAVLALQELGISDATGVDRHPFFSLLRSRFVYELDFEDDRFDFVFSRALDRVSVPALLVLEIERVLRPGGTGAMLVGAHNLYSGSLIRSATPVSSFLKISDVVHVCGIGSFTLVIFKKRFDNAPSFEHFELPDECPSVMNNKPLMRYIEPLVERKSGEVNYSYLPNFMNISSKGQLVYINVGAGEFLETSVAKMLKPHYPMAQQAFDIFVIDHNTSVLSSYVRSPGITFIYHPELAEEKAPADLNSDEYLSAPLDEGRFDFIRWFDETITDGDFVVLMMNAKVPELKILGELLRTGSICRVDELFLHCSESPHCKSAKCGDCMSLFKSLRNSGVFVHQLLGD